MLTSQRITGIESLYRGGAALCLAVMFSCFAHASVVFDNISAVKGGADPVASPLYGYFGPLYDSFSTGADVGVLVDLQFVLSGTPDSGSVDIGLYSDADTSPGLEIVDFGTLYDTSLSNTPTIYEIATGDPVLAPNTRYWIGIRDNSATGITSAFWDWSTDTSGIGVDGEFFANADGVFADEIYGPYQMSVDPVPAPVSSVPEPATNALLPLGASLLLALGFRYPGRRNATNSPV
jgi:hypothetical protein